MNGGGDSIESQENISSWDNKESLSSLKYWKQWNWSCHEVNNHLLWWGCAVIIWGRHLMLHLTPAIVLNSTRHWCVPFEMHCLLLQPFISNYKMPNFILSDSLSRMLTASAFMLHSTSSSQAISTVAYPNIDYNKKFKTTVNIQMSDKPTSNFTERGLGVIRAKQ